MYTEHSASSALRHIVACTWQHESAFATRTRVVPDACVDILWDGSRLSLAGPDTRPVEHALVAGTKLLGLRFVPGAAGALIGVPASAVRDAQVDLHELWEDEARVLADVLHAATSELAALRALETAVQRRLHGGVRPDALALAAVRALQPAALGGRAPTVSTVPTVPTVPTIPELARALGVSDRQLRRRCDAAVGYGPKLLSRVLRFQAFRARLAAEPGRELADLAAALGYADQAHLGHEVMALGGVTPATLRPVGPGHAGAG